MRAEYDEEQQTGEQIIGALKQVSRSRTWRGSIGCRQPYATDELWKNLRFAHFENADGALRFPTALTTAG